MCDCIKRVENLLNESLLKDNPGAEITEQVELQNKTYLLPSFNERLYIPAKGRFKDSSGRNRKFDVSMNFTNCPYCGVKYDNK